MNLTNKTQLLFEFFFFLKLSPSQTGGLVLEKSYPYVAVVHDGCQLDEKAIKYNINGYTWLPATDENKMMIWLAKRGPISIEINAIAMQHYKKGVSQPDSVICPINHLNHGVLVIGYGVDNTTQGKSLPYWTIKNSWGSLWGEQGFYRVYRGNNTCGLAMDPTTSIVSPGKSR